MKKENLTYGELKKMYPIGTEFRSPYSGDLFIIDDYYFREKKDEEFILLSDIRVKIKNPNTTPFIVYNGRLAEIISLPEPKNEIIDNYEIY